MQSGVVSKIAPTETGPVLMINHKPPLNLSLFKKTLPVKVSDMFIIIMMTSSSVVYNILGGWSYNRWKWVQLDANALGR